MENSLNEQIQQWAEQIKHSDRKAFDELFRKLYPRLVYFATGYTRDKAAACDVVQDAFVALWKKRFEIDPASSLKGYLYTAVRNRALNHIRNRSGMVLLDMEEEELPGTEYQKQHLEDSYPQVAKKFEKWIEELPGRQRETFKLSRFDGLDHEEIAGVMGISEKTVNNHIVAALGYLRSCYNTYQSEVNREE
ncbi:MAG: RNA polymerase sigma-70 factor [Balneolaceae bacterium]